MATEIGPVEDPESQTAPSASESGGNPPNSNTKVEEPHQERRQGAQVESELTSAAAAAVAHLGEGLGGGTVSEAARQNFISISLEAVIGAVRGTALRSGPQKLTVFDYPFVVNEEDFELLDARIRRHLPTGEKSHVDVNARVRYTDLSEESFNSLQECLSEAGSKDDPESLVLTYDITTENATFYQAVLTMVTGAPIGRHRVEGADPADALIQLVVSGPDRQIVNNCVESVSDVLKTMRIPRLFRPLEYFRNYTIRTVFSYVLATAAFFASLRLVASLFTVPTNQERTVEILRDPDLSLRFERFVQQLYGTQTPFVVDFTVHMLPYVLLFVVQILAYRHIGHLVPRSAINVGLSSRRYRDYLNVFRFLVFGILVTCILGIVVNLISSAIMR